MSSKYFFIRNMYRMHRITAAQVWSYVGAENGITSDEAVKICGPRSN